MVASLWLTEYFLGWGIHLLPVQLKKKNKAIIFPLKYMDSHILKNWEKYTLSAIAAKADHQEGDNDKPL